LTFLGLWEDHSPSDALDGSLHQPIGTFRRICAFLAKRYQAMPFRNGEDHSAGREADCKEGASVNGFGLALHAPLEAAK
jgi:hypothetical protein